MPTSCNIKALLSALMILGAFTFHAQKNLSVADSAHLAILQTELTLTEDQHIRIDSLLRVSSQHISEIERELLRISRSDASAEEKENLQRELREKKKNVRENRDLSITLLLSAEQRKIYDEKIRPSKPGVLHMGMNHDRSKCEVCVVK
jgi:hypothetical protein